MCHFSLYTSFPTVSKNDNLFGITSAIVVVSKFLNTWNWFIFLYFTKISWNFTKFLWWNTGWILKSISRKNSSINTKLLLWHIILNFFVPFSHQSVCPFSPPHFLALGHLSSVIIIEKGHVRKIHEMCLWFSLVLF